MSSRRCLASAVIGSPTWAEKPGCLQASSFWTSSWEMACLSEQDAEQALAEQPHQLLGVPLHRRVPRAVGASAAVGADEVQVRMPL